MKRILTGILAAGMLAAACFGLAACGGTEEETPKTYAIQAPAESELYTVSGLPEQAMQNETITFTVTLTDPENSELVSVSVLPVMEPAADADPISPIKGGSYSFVMPGEEVEIVIVARAYEQVTQNGGLTFDAANPTVLSVGGGNDTMWGGPNGTTLMDVWTFGLSFTWGNTAHLSSRSYVASSNQDVIPEEAITDFEEGSESGGMIRDASFSVDSSLIRPGTTWLEIYVQSDNVSSYKGTLLVKITVTEDGALQEAETWTETVIFDLQDGVDTETLYFYFVDEDYASNLDSEERQNFAPGSYTVTDGKVTLTIEYVKGHTYSVYAAIDGTGDSYELGEALTNGGAYRNGELTFERTGVSITIIVYEKR